MKRFGGRLLSLLRRVAALRSDRAFRLILSGWALFALCFPPLPLGPLAFIALAPAFLGTWGMAPGRAFRLHFLAGIVFNTLLYWWIYNVMKVGPAFIIFFGLILLILFLSLFNGLAGLLFAGCSRSRIGLLLFPLAFAGLEVARNFGQMSFPWSHAGYALGPHLSWIQLASLVGVSGLSALLIASNLLFARALKEGGGKRIPWALAALSLPLLLALEGHLALREKGKAAGVTVDISLVQPSIPQTRKWDEGYFQDVLGKSWRTLEAGGDLAGTDLVVFAETAVPDFLRIRGPVLEEILHKADSLGTDILIGALDFAKRESEIRPFSYFNSAFLFRGVNPGDGNGGDAKDGDPGAGKGGGAKGGVNGSAKGLRGGYAGGPLAEGDPKPYLQYDKVHLVPFSEALPFENILPVINYVNLGEGDFSAGPGPLSWKLPVRSRSEPGGARDSIAFAPSICYEVIYPAFARAMKAEGASLLVNITNDGWFGRSNAPYQHANIARFRAVEVGLPMARCSNAGVSVFYDGKGRILGKTGLFETTLLRRKVEIVTYNTFFHRHGSRIESLLFLFFALTSAGLLLARKRAPRP